MYFLAKHPEVQQACRAEVLRVLGTTADPTLATLGPDSLPYLHACIHETLRTNPPGSSTTPRTAQVDVMLGKYLIPAGTPLVSNIHAMQHSARVWDEPEVFRPERFLTADGGAEDHNAQTTSQASVKAALGEDDSKAREDAATVLKLKERWMPFSVGPRKCPARNFALYEMRTITAMFLREFEWTLPEGSIHEDEIQNSFFAFSLSLPHDLDITFRSLRQEGPEGVTA